MVISYSFKLKSVFLFFKSLEIRDDVNSKLIRLIITNLGSFFSFYPLKIVPLFETLEVTQVVERIL
jgi:hypothetical protein